MRSLILALMTILTALAAPAEATTAPVMMVADQADHLTAQLYLKSTQCDGGVTAFVGVVGSKESIKLDSLDPNCRAAPLAPAVSSPLVQLKPAVGLAKKPSTAKQPHRKNRALPQLQHIAKNQQPLL